MRAPPKDMASQNTSSPAKRKSQKGSARRSKRIKLDNHKGDGLPGLEPSRDKKTNPLGHQEDTESQTLVTEIVESANPLIEQDMQVDLGQAGEELDMEDKQASEFLHSMDEDILNGPREPLVERFPPDFTNPDEDTHNHEPTIVESSVEMILESIREYSEPLPSPKSTPAPPEQAEPEDPHPPPVPVEGPSETILEPTEDVNDWLMTDVEQSIEEEAITKVRDEILLDELPKSPVKDEPEPEPEPDSDHAVSSEPADRPVETYTENTELIEAQQDLKVVESPPAELAELGQSASPEYSAGIVEEDEITALTIKTNERETSEEDAMDLDLTLDLDITLSPEDKSKLAPSAEPVSALTDEIDETEMSISESIIESASPPRSTSLPRLKTSKETVSDAIHQGQHSSLSGETSKADSESGEFQETADEFARSTMAMPAESSKQTSMSPYPKFEIPATRSARPSTEPQRRPIPPSVEMSSTNLSRLSSPLSAAVTLPTPPAQSPSPVTRPVSPSFGLRSTPRPIGRPPSRPSRGGLRHVNHDADVRSKLLMARPKTAIPTHMDQGDYARECLEAAMSSRLPPYSLHPDEHRLLRTHINHVQVTTYLNIRNGILRLWMLNPTIAVCREEALGVAKEERHLEMAAKCHEFLVRNGHINFGCIQPPRPLSRALELPKENSRTSRRRRRVIVIGAGAAGLGCARQLETLFQQFADRFPRNSNLPEVVVLEGRNRVGGRIYSHPISPTKVAERPGSSMASTSKTSVLSMSSNSSLNANPDQRFPEPAVDLGAQIVTGFDNGNPLAAIVKRQLRLRWHNLHDDSLLFNDTDGKRIDRSQDVRAERLFNDILDRASSLKGRNREQILIEGDRELIEQGKEPHGESGRQIAKVEENEAILPPMPPSPPLSSREKPLSHQSTHATARGNSQGYQVPPRRALTKLGFKLKDDNSRSKDHEGSIPSTHDTLGDTMRSILLDIQAIVDLSPMDLKLLNWHWANLEYGNATNLSKLSLKNWDQDDGNELDLELHFSHVGF